MMSALEKTSTFNSSIVDRLTRGTVPDIECSDFCVNQFACRFLEDYGGFEVAPKFPQPSNLLFLFHNYSQNIDKCDELGLKMALKTLEKMSKGGIHDHIGQVINLFIPFYNNSDLIKQTL